MRSPIAVRSRPINACIAYERKATNGSPGFQTFGFPKRIIFNASINKRPLRPYLTWCVLIAACWTVPGCSPTDGASGKTDGKLRVVCTTSQVADMLRNIGGDHVEVVGLMGPGVDPHLYKATPADRRELNQADVIFYSGLHLEGRLSDLLEKLGRRQPVFAVTEGIREKAPDRLIHAHGSETTFDPHIWFDVDLWSQCVEHAAEKLISADPDHADAYRQNAAKYLAQLKQLDQQCREGYAQIPKPQRVLITAHDAFEYLGRAYGLEVHGLQGISTVDEADLGTVNALVELLADRNVKAVFVESSVPKKNIQALIQRCAARGHTVELGGQLYSDALGPADSPAATYVGAVEHNLHTIVEALK